MGNNGLNLCESFVMLTPSVYNIDAWEDTGVLLVTKSDSLDLLDKIPVLAEWTRKLDEQHAGAAQRKLSASTLNSRMKKLGIHKQADK